MIRKKELKFIENDCFEKEINQIQNIVPQEEKNSNSKELQLNKNIKREEAPTDTNALCNFSDEEILKEIELIGSNDNSKNKVKIEDTGISIFTNPNNEDTEASGINKNVSTNIIENPTVDHEINSSILINEVQEYSLDVNVSKTQSQESVSPLVFESSKPISKSESINQESVSIPECNEFKQDNDSEIKICEENCSPNTNSNNTSLKNTNLSCESNSNDILNVNSQNENNSIEQRSNISGLNLSASSKKNSLNGNNELKEYCSEPFPSSKKVKIASNTDEFLNLENNNELFPNGIRLESGLIQDDNFEAINCYDEDSYIEENVNLDSIIESLNTMNESVISENRSNLLKKEGKYIDTLNSELNRELSVLSSNDAKASVYSDHLVNTNKKALENINTLNIEMKGLFDIVSNLGNTIKFCEQTVNEAFKFDDAKLNQLLTDLETQKSNFESEKLQNLEDQKKELNAQASAFTVEIFNSISSNISTLNLSYLSQQIDSLGTLISEQLIKNEETNNTITTLNSDIKLKNVEIVNLNQSFDLLKAKSQMLDENIDYLNNQNEKLKFRNHHLGLSINIIEAYTNNIANSLSDLSAFSHSFFQLFNKLEEVYNSKYQDLNCGLMELQNNVKVLKESIESIDFDKYKNELDCHTKKISEIYENEKNTLEKRINELFDEISSLRCEISDLKEENLQLKDLNKEVKDEIQLKDSYTKDLEKSIDELMKSNKFYEDQLVRSDELIKSLRDVKQAKSIDLSAEIEKIKKHYLKENGLLKLKIEELESSINL